MSEILNDTHTLTEPRTEPVVHSNGHRGKARGMGRLYRPRYTTATGERRESAIWWVGFSHRGKVYRESAHSTLRAEAVKLLKHRLGEIAQKGRPVSRDAENVTFEDLATFVLTDYRVNGRHSLRRVEQALARLRATFGEDRAVDLTYDRLMGYVAERQHAQAHNATIAYELAILRRAFTLAVKAQRLVIRPPFPALEIRNTREGFFEPEEIEAVCARLSPDVEPIVRFLSLTGWRVGEVLPLTWRQVDLQAGTVRLEPERTKNRDGRTFPFSTYPPLDALLRRQRERVTALERATGRVIPFVWVRDTGEPVRDFRKAWQGACTGAGLPGRLRHDFRRSAVRALERAGVPRSVAMKLTGHKTEAVYRRYAIVSEADLREGVGKLATLYAQTEAEGTRPLAHSVHPFPTSTVLAK